MADSPLKPYKYTRQNQIYCHDCGALTYDGKRHNKIYCSKCQKKHGGSGVPSKKRTLNGKLPGKFIPCQRCGRRMRQGHGQQNDYCWYCRKELNPDKNKPKRSLFTFCITCGKQILNSRTGRGRLYCETCNPTKQKLRQHKRTKIPCPLCGGNMYKDKTGKKSACSDCQRKHKLGKYKKNYWKVVHERQMENLEAIKQQRQDERRKKFMIIAETVGDRIFTNRDIYKLDMETRGGFLEQLVNDGLIVRMSDKKNNGKTKYKVVIQQ